MATGEGTYTWSDGRKYVGEWLNGKENGYGTYSNLEGTTLSGQFYDVGFVGD